MVWKCLVLEMVDVVVDVVRRARAANGARGGGGMVAACESVSRLFEIHGWNGATGCRPAPSNVLAKSW